MKKTTLYHFFFRKIEKNNPATDVENEKWKKNFEKMKIVAIEK
jgi:hypothetical protein